MSKRTTQAIATIKKLSTDEQRSIALDILRGEFDEAWTQRDGKLTVTLTKKG